MPDPLIKSEGMLDRAIQTKKLDTPVKPEYDRQESTFSEPQHVYDNLAQMFFCHAFAANYQKYYCNCKVNYPLRFLQK